MHRYCSFEDPISRGYFKEDAPGLLHEYGMGAVFDEVQHVPELFSHLPGMVDADPSPGRFVLTGSQHFGMNERITQSLAGRSAILELLPFSVDELRHGRFLSDDLNSALWNGCYPPVHDRGLRPDRWYRNYISTYGQRDARHRNQVRHERETGCGRQDREHCGTMEGPLRVPRHRLRRPTVNPSPGLPHSALAESGEDAGRGTIPVKRKATRGLRRKDPLD
jgi:hypothetical protein